jgi:hypothetical protein
MVHPRSGATIPGAPVLIPSGPAYPIRTVAGALGSRCDYVRPV